MTLKNKYFSLISSLYNSYYSDRKWVWQDLQHDPMWLAGNVAYPAHSAWTYKANEGLKYAMLQWENLVILNLSMNLEAQLDNLILNSSHLQPFPFFILQTDNVIRGDGTKKVFNLLGIQG